MAYKIHNNSSGYTLLELLLAVFILTLLYLTVTLFINPAENRAKFRDNKRLSDIQTLDRIISEYHVDSVDYPDVSGVLRTSTSLPGPSSISFASITHGWIDADMSVYAPRLPIDPINDGTYYYSYIRNDTTFELNARLEILTTHAQNDGGNDPTVYEVGDNLNLISP